MAKAHPWTDQDDDTLIQAHAQGNSLHATSKAMGRSTSTVSKHARRLGLAWNRAHTAAATAAVIADGRTRRAALEQRLIDEANKALDTMWEPHEIGAFGGMDGNYHRATVDTPSPSDRRAIMQAATTAAATAAKLAEQNAGTEIDTAKSALTLMQKALEAAHPNP